MHAILLEGAFGDDDLAQRNYFPLVLARAGIQSMDDVGHEVGNFEANGNLDVGDCDTGENKFYMQVEQRRTSRCVSAL